MRLKTFSPFHGAFPCRASKEEEKKLLCKDDRNSENALFQEKGIKWAEKKFLLAGVVCCVLHASGEWELMMMMWMIMIHVDLLKDCFTRGYCFSH